MYLGDDCTPVYINDIDSTFNIKCKTEWFNDRLVQEIIETCSSIDISKAHLPLELYSKVSKCNIGTRSISTGAKTLILAYKIPGVLYEARFRDNCIELLEEIASKVDVMIRDSAYHRFKFKHIDEIEFINYGVKAHSFSEMINLYRSIPFEGIRFKDEEEGLSLKEIENKHSNLMKRMRLLK